MNREELLTDAMLFFSPNERSITAENGARYYREDVVLKAMELAGKESSLPPAEGAEDFLKKYTIYCKNVISIEGKTWVLSTVIPQAMQEFATLHAQRIAEKMVEEQLPSNKEIHEAALAWARDHSEAPDKDCPKWLIRDYEAGAYFVRQCYGCWNKTDKMVSERLREELIAYKTYENIFDNRFTTVEDLIDEYLKTRER